MMTSLWSTRPRSSWARIDTKCRPSNNFRCGHQNCMRAGDGKQLYYKSWR